MPMRHFFPITMMGFLTAGGVFGQTHVISRSEFGPTAVELTFDDLAADFVIGNHYQNEGIVFDNAKVDGRGLYYISPPNLLYPNLTNTAGGTPLTAHFPNGAKRVGVNCDGDGFVGGRQPQMRVFDVNGALIGTQNCLGGGTFLGLEADGGLIYMAQFGAVHPDFGGAFVSSDDWDDVIFEGPCSFVPSSATLPLSGGIRPASCSCSAPIEGLVKPIEDVHAPSPNYPGHIFDGYRFALQILPVNCDFSEAVINEEITPLYSDCAAIGHSGGGVTFDSGSLGFWFIDELSASRGATTKCHKLSIQKVTITDPKNNLSNYALATNLHWTVVDPLKGKILTAIIPKTGILKNKRVWAETTYGDPTQ